MKENDWRNNIGGDSAKHCYCVIIRAEEYPAGNGEVRLSVVPTLQGARKLVPGDTMTPIKTKRPVNWIIAGAYIADEENQTTAEFAKEHANIPAREFVLAGILNMVPYMRVFMPVGAHGPLYPIESGIFYSTKYDGKDSFIRINFQPEAGDHLIMLYGLPFFFSLHEDKMVLKDRYGREADRGRYDKVRLNMEWPDENWPESSYEKLTKYLEDSGLKETLQKRNPQSHLKNQYYYETMFRQNWYASVDGQLDVVSHEAAKKAITEFLIPNQ